jgi:hypothetical protein
LDFGEIMNFTEAELKFLLNALNADEVLMDGVVNKLGIPVHPAHKAQRYSLMSRLDEELAKLGKKES